MTVTLSDVLNGTTATITACTGDAVLVWFSQLLNAGDGPDDGGPLYPAPVLPSLLLGGDISALTRIEQGGAVWLVRRPGKAVTEAELREMARLARLHDVDYFYVSCDVLSPVYAVRLAEAMAARQLTLRWSSTANR